MSDSNDVILSFVEETVFAQTPSGPPTLKDLRVLKDSLVEDITLVSSAELRPDRQVVDVLRTTFNSKGNIDFELNFLGQSEFFQAGLMSDAGWDAQVQQISALISADSGDNKFTRSSGDFGPLGPVGSWVHVSGFSDPANNGFFKITDIPLAIRMDVAGSALVTEGPTTVTLTRGRWIVNGRKFRSFSIERDYSDLATEFAVHRGMAVESFDLAVPLDGWLTGSIGFLGHSEISGSATVGDGSNTAATLNKPMDASLSGMAILENIGVLDGVTGITLSVINNLRKLTELGIEGVLQYKPGKIDVRGRLRMYFADSVLMNKYLGFIETSLTLILSDENSKTLLIDIPRAILHNGTRVAEGINTDLIADFTFSGFKHPTELITIRIQEFDI